MISLLRRVPADLQKALPIAVIVFVYFWITQAGFATESNLYTVVQGLVFVGLGALAFGLTMIAGEMDLAVPGIATVAGIASLHAASAGLVPAVLAGLGTGLGIGLVQGIIVWLVRLHSVVITVGTSSALIGLSVILSHSATVVSPNLDLSPQIQRQLWLFSPGSLIAIAAFVLIAVLLRCTKWGSEIRAFGAGRQEATAAGVPVHRPVLIVFACSGALSGLLGALVSVSVGSASPTSFSGLLLSAVAAALVGGVALTGGQGSALGVAVGVLILQFVNSGLSLGAQAYYVVDLATGVLLLAVVTLDLFTRYRANWSSLRARFERPPGGLAPQLASGAG